MYHQLRIDDLTKKHLDGIKQAYSKKSYNDTIYFLIDFVSKNQLDLEKNYLADMNNILEVNHAKTLKRIEDIVKIIRNIEKDTLVPTSIRVKSIYDNSSKEFHESVLNELKSEIDVTTSEKTIKLEESLKKVTESKDQYLKELNAIRPLVNELLNSISSESGFLKGNELKISMKSERFKEIQVLLNK